MWAWRFNGIGPRRPSLRRPSPRRRHRGAPWRRGGPHRRLDAPAVASDDPRSQQQFAYSPGGVDIAYVSEAGLAVLDVSSGTVTPLADIGGDVDGPSSMVKFSPEGDQILFTRTDARMRRRCGAFAQTAPTSTDWWLELIGAIGKH